MGRNPTGALAANRPLQRRSKMHLARPDSNHFARLIFHIFNFYFSLIFGGPLGLAAMVMVPLGGRRAWWRPVASRF
jgi:hypothetical protein